MTPPPFSDADVAPLSTTPIPIIQNRPLWRDTFSSLRIFNFRLFTAGHIVATTAIGMQRIAQDWLVLELSGSVAAVGITVAMQFAPMLLFGLFGGLIVDRFSKRHLLMITQTLAALLAVALAVLTLTGTVEVWHIWVIAFTLGLVTVVDNPARQVLVNELVGPAQLRNAISVNSSVFQLGQLIGPAIAGVMIVAVGSGWAFVINAVACATVVFTLLGIRAAELVRTPIAPPAKGQLMQGLRYAANKPTIRWTLVMMAFVAVFAFNIPVLLAAFADTVYDVGAGGYGFFNALVAGGALIGAVASTRRRGIRLLDVVATGGAIGLAQLFAGLVPGLAGFVLLLIAVGFAHLLFITGANSLVQMSSNVQIRGRVMSIYILVLLGGQAIGGPLMGLAIEQWGAHVGLMISGGVPALAALVLGLGLARSRGLKLRMSLRRADPFVQVVLAR